MRVHRFCPLLKRYVLFGYIGNLFYAKERELTRNYIFNFDTVLVCRFAGIDLNSSLPLIFR